MKSWSFDTYRSGTSPSNFGVGQYGRSGGEEGERKRANEVWRNPGCRRGYQTSLSARFLQAALVAARRSWRRSGHAVILFFSRYVICCLEMHVFSAVPYSFNDKFTGQVFNDQFTEFSFNYCGGSRRLWIKKCISILNIIYLILIPKLNRCKTCPLSQRQSHMCRSVKPEYNLRTVVYFITSWTRCPYVSPYSAQAMKQYDKWYC